MQRFTNKPTTLYRIKTYAPEEVDKYRAINLTKKNLQDRYVYTHPTQQQQALLKHKATHIPDLARMRREKHENIEIVPNLKVNSEQAKTKRMSQSLQQINDQQTPYKQHLAQLRKQSNAYRAARREWTLKAAGEQKFDIGYELEEKRLAANFHYRNLQEDVVY